MDETDSDYFQRRATEEKHLAELTDCAEARCVHLQLAEAYERIVGRLTASMPNPVARQIG